MTTQEQCGGKRGTLKTKLETIEFYCLTCKNKRKVRSGKNIEVKKTKNNRHMAVAKCDAGDCTRKLVKFLSKDEVAHLSSLKTKKTTIAKTPKAKVAKTKK